MYRQLLLIHDPSLWYGLLQAHLKAIPDCLRWQKLFLMQMTFVRKESVKSRSSDPSRTRRIWCVFVSFFYTGRVDNEVGNKKVRNRSRITRHRIMPLLCLIAFRRSPDTYISYFRQMPPYNVRESSRGRAVRLRRSPHQNRALYHPLCCQTSRVLARCCHTRCRQEGGEHKYSLVRILNVNKLWRCKSTFLRTVVNATGCISYGSKVAFSKVHRFLLDQKAVNLFHVDKTGCLLTFW